jgi:hypothetical protein
MFETLIWLKKPLRAPDLPRRRILADCLAALRPNEELWRRYVDEIERLRADEDFAEEDVVLLRDSLEAKVELMEVTLGEPQAFGEGTIAEVLRRAKANVQGEAAAEITELKTELEQTASAEAAQAALFEARGRTISRRITRGLLLLITAFLLVLVYLTLPSDWNALPSHLESVIAPLIFGAFVLLGLLSILNLIFGTTAQSLLERLEIRLERWLIDLQMRIAGRR